MLNFHGKYRINGSVWFKKEKKALLSSDCYVGGTQNLQTFCNFNKKIANIFRFDWKREAIEIVSTFVIRITFKKKKLRQNKTLLAYLIPVRRVVKLDFVKITDAIFKIRSHCVTAFGQQIIIMNVLANDIDFFSYGRSYASFPFSSKLSTFFSYLFYSTLPFCSIIQFICE